MIITGILDPLKKTGDSVDSWTAGIHDSIWTSIMGGFLILIAGVIGLIAGQPWLFFKSWTNSIFTGRNT